MKIIFSAILFFLVFSLQISAQVEAIKQNPAPLRYISGEVSNIRISGQNVLLQQTNFGARYQKLENFGILYSVAVGLIGENPAIPHFSSLFTQLAMGADYMYKFNESYKLGVEAMVEYGYGIFNSNYNVNHYGYKTGIKLDFRNNFFAGGLRSRNFYVNKLPSSEVYLSVGYTFPVLKK